MAIWFIAGLLAVVMLAGAGYMRSTADWRAASWESTGLAPDPATTREPVVQVYAARTVGWRGMFGVHTWIAVKPAAAREYTVYEVIGWRLRGGGSPVVIRTRTPDAPWFGSVPEVIAEKRGALAEPLLARINSRARTYPWPLDYSLWPGPNSNTFTAWILRGVPELGADLPPTAIGKDYTGDRLITTAPSGAGVQFSVFGLLGLIASRVEGLELNVLGLTIGINPFDPSIKLPLIGRVGPPRLHSPKSALSNPV